MLKNNIQATLLENGIVLSLENKKKLFSARTGEESLNRHSISDASKISLKISLNIMWKVQEEKERLVEEIMYAGKPFEKQIKLLITIRGITPLTALAFISDVGDITRFKTLRKMNSYLGLAPRIKESGNKSFHGHINRASRNLTRTILTQSLVQAMFASPTLKKFYEELKYRRGAGRARIALIRKLCSIMRRMLLNEEEFKNTQSSLYNIKLRRWIKVIEKIEENKKSA